MDTNENDMNKINYLINNIASVAKTGNKEKFKELITVMHDVNDKALLCSCFNNANINLISLLCEYRKKTLLSYLLHQSHVLHYFTSDSGNKLDDIKFKEDVFYKAMCSDVFEILEMLYDYWSGDLHWLGHRTEYNNLDVQNLMQLGLFLHNAFKRYESYCKLKQRVDQSMVFSVQSLIAFNYFQYELYSKLNNLKNKLIMWQDEPEDIVRLQETYAIRKIIVSTLDTYEEHQELVQKYNKSSNPNSLISKASFYFSHEVFFRKLDSNICLLILDNLHLLKLRLSMPKNVYQILESKLYQFNYQVTTKWRLYWPKKKKVKSKKLWTKYNNVTCNFTIKYDANKWEGFYYIIFLERRDFENAINNFKDEILDINIEENIKIIGSKPTNEDLNSLILLPELRDDYSLRQMSQHIAQLYSIDLQNDEEYGFLLIERTLQVVGEFLKSTDESLHLKVSTAALLKAEISVKFINDLKSLRNILCHAKKGKLLKIIDLETNKSDMFEKIRNELLCMKRKIDVVIYDHKPFIEKALIQNSLSVMCVRRNEIPEILGDIFFYAVDNLGLLHDDCGQYFTEILSRLTLLIHEAGALFIIYLHVQPKLYKVKEKIRKNIGIKFPFYRDAITNSLNKIRDHMSDWNSAVNIVKTKRPNLHLSDYPNENDTNKIISFIMKENVKSNVVDNFLDNFVEDKLFVDIYNHWSFILHLIEFMVVDASIFEGDKIKEFEMLCRLEKLQNCDYNLIDRDSIVSSYLEEIKNELNTVQNDVAATQPFYFFGIKELTDYLKKANFLTSDEKTYMLKFIEENVTRNGTLTRGNQKIKTKIENNTPIPTREYENFFKSIASDKKTENILMNLVMGKKRDAKLALCLKNRISLLKEVTKNQSEKQLIVCYKLDKTFRVLLEVLLFDIFDILENDAIINKSNRLLTEINLRNILTHGSPLLDVVGNILDSDDLPTEIVTKALKFIGDEQAINALCTLMEDSGFDFIEINSNNLTPEQKALVDTFKTSERWKSYLQLIPDYKKVQYEQRQSNKKSLKMPQNLKMNYDTLPDLVKAVYTNDSKLVQEIITKGADVNFIDDHKKAAIHHAAIMGYVDVIKVLLNKKADINIQNGESCMTALHYSAMHGYVESVELLLRNKADFNALDGKGRSPVYLANQRKKLDISRIILKAMKKKTLIDNL